MCANANINGKSSGRERTLNAVWDRSSRCRLVNIYSLCLLCFVTILSNGNNIVGHTNIYNTYVVHFFACESGVLMCRCLIKFQSRYILCRETSSK